jgi:hypothetical protein
MKLIDKDELLADIENLLDNGKYHEEYDCAYRDGNNGALYALKNKLNTLETKEVDLEKEINDYFITVELCEGEKITENTFRKIAKHFFELGIFSQLTWKDIRLISEIGEDFMNSEESDNLGEEEYYTMILNKLKEKGRDYKTERQITRELEQKGE